MSQQTLFQRLHGCTTDAAAGMAPPGVLVNAGCSTDAPAVSSPSSRADGH